MTQADLEYLKASVDKCVVIETCHGEHLAVKVISVFENEADPDVFFDVVDQRNQKLVEPRCAYSLPLTEIAAVKPLEAAPGQSELIP